MVRQQQLKLTALFAFCRGAFFAKMSPRLNSVDNQAVMICAWRALNAAAAGRTLPAIFLINLI